MEISYLCCRRHSRGTSAAPGKMSTEGNFKYLDYLQAAISRMAGNAFTIKGWTITICTALLGFTVKESSTDLLKIAWLPVLTFWWLDAYFLVLERRYRHLFEAAIGAAQAGKPAEFQMSPGTVSPLTVAITMLSPTLLPIHGTLVAVLATVWIVV